MLEVRHWVHYKVTGASKFSYSQKLNPCLKCYSELFSFPPTVPGEVYRHCIIQIRHVSLYCCRRDSVISPFYIPVSISSKWGHHIEDWIPCVLFEIFYDSVSIEWRTEITFRSLLDWDLMCDWHVHLPLNRPICETQSTNITM